MSPPSLPCPPVADWDRLPFVGLLGGIVVLGLAMQLFIVVYTPTWTSELERVSGLVPIVVATLAFVRYRPTAATWEICAVVVWGVLAQWIVFVGWFIVGPAVAARASVSAILLSGGAEYRLRMLLQFLGTVTVFGGFYAAAASRHDRPVGSAVILLAVPVAIILVYVIL